MKYKYLYNHVLVQYAQKNKKSQTDAEKRLWFHLRGKNLNGYKFRRQYPIQNYILDFYCVEKKLAIELDGSQHLTNKKYDTKRTKSLNELGIRVLRFWDNDLLRQTSHVLDKILLELEKVDD